MCLSSLLPLPIVAVSLAIKLQHACKLRCPARLPPACLMVPKATLVLLKFSGVGDWNWSEAPQT